jgi:RNA polymerase-binding protein DksA
MVAKKTAEQSASGRSRGTGASGGVPQDASGRKSTRDGPATGRARTPARKTPARNTSVDDKAPAGKTPAGKAPAGETPAGKTPAGDTPAAAEPVKRKAAPGRAAEPEKTGTAAKETRTRGETAAKAASGARTTAKRTTAARSAAQEGASARGRKSTGKKVGAARAAKQTGATTVVAKKTPGTATAAKSAVPKARVAAAVEPGDLAVRPGEDPWTAEEVAQARALLQSEMERLRTEISSSAASLAGLMRDSGDGAGDDQADTGTKNITREHEMALAANARETLTQTERALDELDAGTYGLCESCGNPIGKARMQAFPRATLCVECKQKQERR